MASKQPDAAAPKANDDVIVVDPETPTVLVVDTSSSEDEDSDDSGTEHVRPLPAQPSAGTEELRTANEPILIEESIDVDEDPAAEVSSTVSSSVTIVPAPDVDQVETTLNKEETSVAKKNSSGLGLLAAYGSGSDDSDIEDITDMTAISQTPAPAPQDDTYELASAKLKNFIEAGEYRIVSDDDSEEDDSDDDNIAGGSRVVHSGSDDDSDVEIVSKSKEFVKARGELGIDDLPPIEDLQIQVPENECVQMGKIFSIVEQLVLVDSLPGTVPLDLETVLFLDKGNVALGRVFDVLGNISEPLYCIRFNSNEEIVAKGLKPGTPVFVAPKTEHTTFVILGNLMGEKGCDASWEHDIEPPLRCVDFSDDEEERSARKVRRGKKGAPADGSALDEGQKRQRNISVSSEQSSVNGDNHRSQHQIPPQRFQRGGGRGGRGGNFRGRGGNAQSFNQHQLPPQNYHQQQFGGHNQGDWSNTQPANYSWHNNIPFTGPPPPHYAPPHQGGGYQQPPPPHMANPYGNSRGYPPHPNNGGPAPYAYPPHQQHPQRHEPPPMYGNHQQMYPSGPPPAARQHHHQQQQQQQTQQQPPPPGAYYQHSNQ